jgi:5S rRNA maturation endonuclease (ribonuclease M5)
MANAPQRFRKSSPCPICHGYEELPRGNGERCYGFLSTDGEYAHCTRPEHAGSLKPDPNGDTYAHRLVGNCKCGVRHDPTPPHTSSNGHKRRIIAIYDYVDKNGTLLYQTVRYAPKDFRQRRPDGHGGWIWNLKDARSVIFLLPAIQKAIAEGQTVCIAEGEDDVLALKDHGHAATCNHGGAGKWTDVHSQFLEGTTDVVLFGDNDEAGRKHLKKQTASLKKMGITPRVAQMDGLPENGDIRDWLKTHTSDDLARLIKEAPPAIDEPASAEEPYDTQERRERSDEPKDPWIRGGYGKIVSCQHNAILWLTHHGYDQRIVLDTFKQSIVVDGQPLTDDTTIEMIRQMEDSQMVRWAESHVHSAMVSLGNRNAHSSLTRWLDSLKWDGTRRIDVFFSKTYDTGYSKYTAACGEVLFLSAVARAYKPGCKADVVVVLIGDQGLGKSKGIEDLVPNQSWFTDDLGGDLYDRKAAEGLQGKWIVEFGEFARINRATLDVVKAFLSRRVDHYRPAYGRVTKDFPRQCIFVGTTNNPLPLQDLENRRFMPVRCRSYNGEIPKLRDQLWAEAVVRYKKGHPWWITDATLIETVKAEQEDARQHDEWEDILRESLVGIDTVTLSDVAERLGIKADRLDKSVQTRLGLVMKAIGFMRKRETSGTRTYYWKREVLRIGRAEVG